MALPFSANSLSVVHKGSKAKAMATIPDICKTPFPAPPGPLPLPYPLKGESKDLTLGSMLTKAEGEMIAVFGCMFQKTTGDAPGSLGGLISGVTGKFAMFIGFSPDVKVEYRPVCRKTDKMLMNVINTVCLSGVTQADGAKAKKVKPGEAFILIQYKYSNTEPIAGAEVEITFSDGSKETHKTDKKGEILIENLPDSKRGKYSAVVKRDPWKDYFKKYDKEYYKRFGLQKPKKNTNRNKWR